MILYKFFLSRPNPVRFLGVLQSDPAVLEQTMSLQPKVRTKIPSDTAVLGRKLLARDNPYRLIGERLADLIQDEDFSSLYSPIGGPAISPSLLALVTIFQLMEKLPDRSAAAAVVMRIDWKYALHLPLDDPGFHFSNLQHFRQRLLDHQAEYLVFDQLLHRLVELGLVRQRGKQRTDSTHVLGLLAKLSRLEMVWETLRLSLRAIQVQDERWLERMVPESFLKTYLDRRSDYNLSTQQVAAELRQAGADGVWWLQQLNHAPGKWQELPEIQTLRTVWDQQFEWDEDNYRGPRTKLDGHDLISTPHEPEAQFRQRRGRSWLGYMAQVSETAEAKGDPTFITDVAVTTAQSSDKQALPDIQTRLEKRDLAPQQQIADQNYISGTNLARSQQRGIELVGPIIAQPGPEGFKLDDFEIDLEKNQARCPAGKTSVLAYVRRRSDDSIEHHFGFGKQCAMCGLRTECTTAKKGRTVKYHQYHEYVVQRRLEMQTGAFQQIMKLRPPVEAAISQLARLGARRARYRGQRRVQLQWIFSAIAVNLRRLCRWWTTGKQPSWQSSN
jgi:transposase